jgi:hypothetical protein
MPPIKDKQDKSARDPRTSGQKAVSVHIKRSFFKRYTEDPEVKRVLMKGIQGILDLVARDKAVLCQKSEKQDDTDTTILTVMSKDDIVEGTPEAEEKPKDKQDTSKAEEKPKDKQDTSKAEEKPDKQNTNKAKEKPDKQNTTKAEERPADPQDPDADADDTEADSQPESQVPL